MSIFSREKLSRWRLSKLFFYIFLFALPFQTRKIFFTDNSFYFDYFSFYNAWYLYLTDLLFLCIIVGWIVENVWFSRLPTGQAGEKWKMAILAGSLVLLTTGQVVTFSRLAWFVTGFAILVFAVLVIWRVRNRDFFNLKTGRLAGAGSYRLAALGVILLSLLLSLALNWFLFGQQIQDRLGLGPRFAEYTSDESFVDRAKFNNVAVEMIKNKPLFGVGLRNFVVAMDDYAEERLLPYLHQPAHNIYLLIVAESGVLALVVFLFFLFGIVRHAWVSRGEPILRYVLVLTFFGFLAISFFDHYLWTIQQGELMFWVVLGLMNARKEA